MPNPEPDASLERPRAVVPVDGVILAAGRSTRMGRPKAELVVGGRTFLERAVDVLRAGGCRSVAAVVAREREVAGAAVGDVVYTLNPDPASPPAASLGIGLEALPADSGGAFVLPVDFPCVRAETVAALIRAFHGSRALIVRPVHDGRPGHPTLFAHALYPALIAAKSLPRGAESVVAENRTEILDIPVDDAGVVENVNTPDEYRRVVGEGPPR